MTLENFSTDYVFSTHLKGPIRPWKSRNRIKNSTSQRGFGILGFFNRKSLWNYTLGIFSRLTFSFIYFLFTFIYIFFYLLESSKDEVLSRNISVWLASIKSVLNIVRISQNWCQNFLKLLYLIIDSSRTELTPNSENFPVSINFKGHTAVIENFQRSKNQKTEGYKNLSVIGILKTSESQISVYILRYYEEKSEKPITVNNHLQRELSV